MTDYTEFGAQIEAARRAMARQVNGSRPELLMQLAHAGCTRAVVSFSGSGDSGNIDDVALEGVTELPDWLDKKLMAWVDVYLESTGVDWYNNDGGFGEIELIPPSNRLIASVSQYRTESDEVWSEDTDDEEAA